MTPRLSEQRAVRPPTDGVFREAPFALRAAMPDEEPGDGLTMDGFGAVFGRETIIDSWEGRFRERIALGAMKRSFRETPPKVQFDHGRHPMIGSIPIAKLERIAEESDPDLAPEGGAHIVARLFNNWLMQPVRDAIEAGAINGMSFRFSVVRELWETADGRAIKDNQALAAELERTWDASDGELPVRTLKELKVPEMGPVVWPAYADTSVGVRSVIDLGRLRQGDPEQRKLLAEAVFIADAASQDEDAQRDTAEVVEHPSTPEDAQQITGTPVETRPSATEGAQQSTDSVGERPSQSKRGYRAVDLMVRKSRDVLLDIQSKGTTP